MYLVLTRDPCDNEKDKYYATIYSTIEAAQKELQDIIRLTLDMKDIKVYKGERLGFDLSVQIKELNAA